MPDIGRNDPCHCGSNKKYKKCCQDKDAAKEHTALEKAWNKSVKEFEKNKEDAEKAAGDNKPSIPGQHAGHNLGNVKQQKHSASVAPKFNMPRKAGGGGA